MARVRVMYWKEIPVQVQAEDESGQISKQLDERFQQGVDAVSMFDGSANSDEYLMAWNWGNFIEMECTSEEAASAVATRYNNGMPQDFVNRIRDLHKTGLRDPNPGAIDNWLPTNDPCK